MFGHQPQYNSYLRKFVVLFGTLFNDIRIARLKDDDTVQTIKVPLTYGSQDRLLARVQGDPTLDKPVAAISPAMSFEYEAPFYDATRKLQSTLTTCLHGEDGLKTQFVSVPYNIPFKLYIYSKDEEDGLRIVEDILPYFTPSLIVNVKMIDGYDYKKDVPIVLDSIDFENKSYGEYPERRSLLWTLHFTMKAEFGGPITGNRKLIKTVHANIRHEKFRDIMEEVHVQVGMTANGEPTTELTETIAPSLIDEEDNWGYIVEILEGPTPHP